MGVNCVIILCYLVRDMVNDNRELKNFDQVKQSQTWVSYPITKKDYLRSEGSLFSVFKALVTGNSFLAPEADVLLP